MAHALRTSSQAVKPRKSAEGVRHLGVRGLHGLDSDF